MNELFTKLWSREWVRRTITVLLTLMALVSLVQGIRNAGEFSQDFQWDAAKAFTMRINPYDESMHPGGVFEAYGFGDYYLQMEANQFPSLLMLLIPYTFLQPLTARYAWIVSNLLFTAGIVFLLRKTFLRNADKDIFAVFMLLMIAGTPYRNQLGVGQHTLFAFFFFLLAVWSDTQKNRKAAFAGTVLCLFVCYFKYTLTVPLCLYFVYRKRYAQIAVSVFMHVVLTAVSAWWLGDSFINMLIKPLKVSSALAAEGGLDFGALLGGSPLAYVMAFAVMVFLLILSVMLGRMKERQDKNNSDNTAHERMLNDPAGNELMSVLILWSLIITYHRTYDFFVMVTVLAFYLAKERSLFLKTGYGVVTVAVFFGLRLFSESAPSKILVGILYYAFTLTVTGTVISGLSKDMK